MPFVRRCLGFRRGGGRLGVVASRSSTTGDRRVVGGEGDMGKALNEGPLVLGVGVVVVALIYTDVAIEPRRGEKPRGRGGRREGGRGRGCTKGSRVGEEAERRHRVGVSGENNMAPGGKSFKGLRALLSLLFILGKPVDVVQFITATAGMPMLRR